MTNPGHRSELFRGDLQGLRAVAVGMVIVAHLATYQLGWHGGVTGGFTGVDVFFVLSGYFITSLLVREVATSGTVDLGGFYARRARRILPIATLILILVVLLATIFRAAVDREQITGDSLWSGAFLANWHFAHSGFDYFDTSTLSPVQHFWSLAVEEQFYLIWPAVVWFIARRRRNPVALLTTVITTATLASLVWSIFTTSYHGPESAHMAYFSFPARAYELGIGALIAIHQPRLRSIGTRTALGVLGLATIVASTVGFHEGSAFPGWQALVPCLGTAALIVAGAGTPTVVQRLLSDRRLRYIGDISYSAYLWHFPIIVFAPQLFPGWSNWYAIPVELVLMLVLSSLSYALVEEPFRRGRVHLISRGRLALLLWPAASLMLVCAVFSSHAYAEHQTRQRQQEAEAWFRNHSSPTQPKEVARLAPTARINNELNDAIQLAKDAAPFPPTLDLNQIDGAQPGGKYMCFANTGSASLDRECTYGDKDATRVVALVGDSHAGMLSPILDRLGKRKHFKVLMFQKLGCGPYAVPQWTGTTASECVEFRTWTADQVAAIEPAVVVLSGRGYLEVEPGGMSVADAWKQGVEETVRHYRDGGAKVVVIGDVPSRGVAPKQCIEGHSQQQSCMVAPTTPESQSNPVSSAAAKSAGAAYLTMQQFVCAHHACPLVVGSRILYWDNSHLSRVWLDHIAKAVIEKLEPLVS